jgi:hypothetical protein
VDSRGNLTGYRIRQQLQAQGREKRTVRDGKIIIIQNDNYQKIASLFNPERHPEGKDYLYRKVGRKGGTWTF